MKKRTANRKTLQIASLLALSTIAVATVVLLLVPDADPIPLPTETLQSSALAAETSGVGLQPVQMPTMTTNDPLPLAITTTGSGSQATASATARTSARNPFIADTQPAAPTGPAETVRAVAATPVQSTAYTTSGRTYRTTSIPRYASESAFFAAKIPLLREALLKSRFISAVYEVDPANPSIMLVLTDTEARARNLDGFFRIAADKDGETWGGAPLAMGMDRLYTEAGRDRAYADGTFCSDGLDTLLDTSIRTMLGGAYEPGITAFILERYKAGMSARLVGEPRLSSIVVASFTWLDVIYREGYASYAEFYPNPDASKG
jgi:hypothetical protein